MLNLLRFAPSQLFSDATTTLLMPSVRSLGPLTMEQVHGAIPSPLPLGQSLIVVWPQLTGLIAATVVCFAFVLRFFYEKGSSFPLIRLISEKALTCVWDKSLSLIVISLFMQFPV